MRDDALVRRMVQLRALLPGAPRLFYLKPDN